MHNKKSFVDDNLNLPVIEYKGSNKDVLIFGGGNSIRENNKALSIFLKQKKALKVIHTGLKYISNFREIENDQYYALVGFEGDNLLDVFDEVDLSNKKIVCPPHPRKMGTLIPKEILRFSYELASIDFTRASDDSPLAIAIQLAINMKADNIYFVGFDGYDTNINKSQFRLVQENQNIFLDLLKIKSLKVSSLTPSKYDKLECSSIYSLLR